MIEYSDIFVATKCEPNRQTFSNNDNKDIHRNFVDYSTARSWGSNRHLDDTRVLRPMPLTLAMHLSSQMEVPIAVTGTAGKDKT